MRQFFLIFRAMLAIAIGLVTACPAYAANSAIYKAVQGAIQAHAARLPGKVSFEIGNHADESRYQQCQRWSAEVAPGARPWGKISVRVQCAEGMSANLYVSANIKVEGSYIVLARAVAGGQVLSINDLKLVNGEISALPADIVTQPAQAVGRRAKSYLAAERPINLNLLRNEFVITSGQEITIVVKTTNFEVSNTGLALDSGGVGDSIRIKLSSGQIISAQVVDKGLASSRI